MSCIHYRMFWLSHLVRMTKFTGISEECATCFRPKMTMCESGKNIRVLEVASLSVMSVNLVILRGYSTQKTRSDYFVFYVLSVESF